MLKKSILAAAFALVLSPAAWAQAPVDPMVARVSKATRAAVRGTGDR